MELWQGNHSQSNELRCKGQRTTARQLSSCGSFLILFYNCPNVELGRTAVPRWPLTLGLRGSIAQNTVLEAGTKGSDFLSFFFFFPVDKPQAGIKLTYKRFLSRWSNFMLPKSKIDASVRHNL